MKFDWPIENNPHHEQELLAVAVRQSDIKYVNREAKVASTYNKGASIYIPQSLPQIKQRT
jgi:hypothetical protein